MGIKVYIDLHSQPSRAIVLFIRMNKLDVEIKNVSLFKGEHRSDWFLKLNPMHAVPVLEDGDFTLTESAAILRYLASKLPIDAHWYPRDAQVAARLEEFVVWMFCPGGLRTNGVGFFVARAVTPTMTGQPPDQELVKEKSENLKASLDNIENYFLSRGDFLAGSDDITVADLLAICEIMQPISVDFDVTGGRPKLAKWFDKVKARLQPHFDDTHTFILEFGAKVKAK